MRVRLAITLLALLAATPIGAGGFDPQADPDYLVPVQGEADKILRDYDRQVRSFLRPPGWAEAVAIRRPSFEPEECVAIHRAKDDPTRLAMTHTRAGRNIWFAKCRRAVTVSRRDVPLPADLARRIGRVWNGMLIQVGAHSGDGPAAGERFGGEPFGALDDTVFIFERHGMRGETSDSTSGESTGRLVALADALFEHANAGLLRRAVTLKKVEAACRDLKGHLVRTRRS